MGWGNYISVFFKEIFKDLVAFVKDFMYMLISTFSFSMPNILSGCRPRCSPDPCQNGARCVEMWNDYRCICTNEWAHSGQSCEISKCFKDTISLLDFNAEKFV